MPGHGQNKENGNMALIDWNDAERTIRTLGGKIEKNLKTVPDMEFLKYKAFFEKTVTEETKRRGLK